MKASNESQDSRPDPEGFFSTAPEVKRLGIYSKYKTKRRKTMLKKNILAIIAIFISWSILDFVIHGIILKGAYEETAHLWRPMDEMKMGLMYIVGFIYTICFVLIYSVLINPKSLMTGLKFGVIFGMGVGISMGYGLYCVMPLPHYLAFIWFTGTLVEICVGGLLLGLIVKNE